jgi:1-acyl-sn-glycerol-3-phosphate acyltransferase
MRFVIASLTPLVWLFCRVFFRVRFHGVENIPDEGACIITPNHVTYADPIWITIPVRRRIYYMAWDKPFEIPVLGFLMRAFGAFPLNLDSIDPSAHRSALDLLRRGCALVVFPEGGRAKTDTPEPFKPGAFRLALKHGLPVVPVSIQGAYDIWPVGKIFPRPGRLTITYHPPIEVERVPDDTTRAELRHHARELARRTREVVARALEEEGKRKKAKGRSVSEIA